MRDLITIDYDGTTGGPEMTSVEWRQADTSLFLRDTGDLVMGGVRGGTVTNVGFTATVAPLTVVCQTLWSRGVYRAAFPGGSAELSKTINAAHATLPRVDAIDIIIYDHQADGSNKRGADIVYTAGTAASSPAAPSMPSPGVGFRLGTFAVPANGGGNPSWTANANLVGYANAGGILDVAVRPATPRPGTVIYNRLTGALEVFHASAWRNILSTVWSSWVPQWTAATTNPQRGNGIEAGAYRMVGGVVDAHWRYQFNTTFVIGIGDYAWTLPVIAQSDWSNQPIGTVAIKDASASSAHYIRHAAIVGNLNSFGAVSEGAVRVGPTNPVTLASGDSIGIVLRYRPDTEAP